MELLFNGSKVSVWEEWEVQEVDSGECCTTLWVYLKMAKTVNVICILPPFLKKSRESSAGGEKAAGDKRKARSQAISLMIGIPECV